MRIELRWTSTRGQASGPLDLPVVDLAGAAYEYEPSEDAILETLLPEHGHE